MFEEHHMEPRIIHEIIYYPEAGVIAEVLNDDDDRGILSWGLYFKFGNIGQSTGHRRSSTIAGQKEIESVLNALDSPDLSSLKGKTAIALHVGGRSGQISGVANANNPKKFAIFKTPSYT